MCFLVSVANFVEISLPTPEFLYGSAVLSHCEAVLVIYWFPQALYEPNSCILSTPHINCAGSPIITRTHLVATENPAATLVDTQASTHTQTYNLATQQAI